MNVVMLSMMPPLVSMLYRGPCTVAVYSASGFSLVHQRAGRSQNTAMLPKINSFQIEKNVTTVVKRLASTWEKGGWGTTNN